MEKLPLSGRCKIWLYAGITEYLLVLVTRQRVAVKIQQCSQSAGKTGANQNPQRLHAKPTAS